VRLVQSPGPRGSDSRDAACEALVARYQSLVRACAQRYWQSPEPQEELMQVGYVGLLKAINNFDPAFGQQPRCLTLSRASAARSSGTSATSAACPREAVRAGAGGWNCGERGSN